MIVTLANGERWDVREYRYFRMVVADGGWYVEVSHDMKSWVRSQQVCQYVEYVERINL